MADDLRLEDSSPAHLIDPEWLAHALARADLKARLFGAPNESARVGRFAVLRQVGSGGMGVVYAAYDEQLDRRIALKLIPAGHHDPAGAARSKREAQALARLSHPNVVQVHEVGEARGQVYIAMEFVQGETLRAWQERAPRSWREVLAVYVQAGRGLAAAHVVGVVHRDFKPENVLVGDDGRPRVVDFGLARGRTSAGGEERPEQRSLDGHVLKDMSEDAREKDGPEITGAEAAVETPAYLAPEQHAGGEADARSDVFSFCVALHEALHGVRPFAGERAEEVHQAIVDGVVTHGSRDVPAWLQRVVERGLLADPAARWQGMEALLVALGRDPTRLRRWIVVALVVTGVVVGGGLGLWQRLEVRHARDVEEERARAAGATAELQRAEAEAEARRLAAASQGAAGADPGLRLLLAVEAVAAVRERGEAPPVEVEQALLDALDGPRSELFIRPGSSAVSAVAESRDGRRLATGERDGAVALWSTADPRVPLDVVFGTGAVQALAFADDGEALAIARAGDKLRVAAVRTEGRLKEDVFWDSTLSDPRELGWSARGALVVRDGGRAIALRPEQAPLVLGTEAAPVRRALWSPDGGALLTIAADGALRLWPEAGGSARALRLPPPALRGAVGLWSGGWRSDGVEVVVARADRTAVIVPVDGGPPERLVGHTDEVYAAAFLPGHDVVTVSRDGSARVWERDGDSERVALSGHDEALFGLHVGPDLNLLLGTPAGGEVWLWQLDVRGPPLRLRGHTGGVVAAGFSSDGARVLSGSVDGSARRWRIADDAWLLRGHAAAIEQAIFLADNHTVVTASLDGTARVWRRDGRPSAGLGGHREGGSVVLAPSPDGRRLLSAGGDGRIRLWSLTGDEPVPGASIPGEPSAALLAARWSPAGDLAAVAGEDGRVSLIRFDPAGLPILAELVAHAGPVHVLQFVSDGTAIASAGEDGEVRVTPIGESPVSEGIFMGHVGPVRALAAGSVDHRLASAGDDAIARVWSLTGPEAPPLLLRGHTGAISQVELRADGRAALTASVDGSAREWPLEGGEPTVLRGHTDAVWIATYSPDGAAILTASADGSARLWTRDGEALTSLVLPHSPAGGPGEPDRTLWAGAFAPDGRLVVTAGADGLARVFPVAIEGRLAEACARAGRDLTRAEWNHHLGARRYRSTCS